MPLPHATAFALPPVAAHGEGNRLLLRAARTWVLIACRRRSPRPAMLVLLGPAGRAFSTLMDAMVTAWPEPFITYPPCATSLSPDESTLLRLIADAQTGDRAGADRLLADMLPLPVRDRLWSAARTLADEALAVR
jgi:hypothetical protein